MFYNRLLRCYVLIDLKPGKLTHQDLGQMQMYVNYFDRYVKADDELPTVGILLCDRKKDTIVELTLPEDANIYASKYQLYLPSKQELAEQLAMVRREVAGGARGVVSEERVSGEGRDPDGVGYEPKVPAGYRRTEVGVIPEDWQVDRIDQHTLIKTGSKNTQDKEEGEEYPFFVRSADVERIGTYSYDGEAVLTAGDGVGTGKVFHYVRGRFDVHQRVYRISHFSDRLNGQYFFFQFSERFYHRIMSMTAKSSVDSVRMEMIAGMLLPLPSPREQSAIAAVLSDVEELIGSLEALIAKRRAVKQAAMQELLTGRTRLPGFGGEWETGRLGDLGTFYKGRGIRRDELGETGVCCVRYGTLYTRYENYVVKPVSRIPEQVADSALPIRQGDLLFAGSGETAEEIGICVAYIGEEPALRRRRHHRLEVVRTGRSLPRAPSELPASSPSEGAYGSG